jgi:transposase-like protein
MQVLGELKHRGVSDILICCVAGLTGFPKAIEAIFPLTTVQTCILHLIRRSMRRRREECAPGVVTGRAVAQACGCGADR